jgi:hypothetical protein
LAAHNVGKNIVSQYIDLYNLFVERLSEEMYLPEACDALVAYLKDIRHTCGNLTLDDMLSNMASAANGTHIEPPDELDVKCSRCQNPILMWCRNADSDEISKNDIWVHSETLFRRCPGSRHNCVPIVVSPSGKHIDVQDIDWSKNVQNQNNDEW